MNGKQPMTWDLIYFFLFSGLGVATSFVSVNIPHTEVFLDIRWLFGIMGFTLIGRLPIAILIPVVLSLAGEHKVPLYVALLGNLFYAIPLCFSLRLLYQRLLPRIPNHLLYAAVWTGAVLAGYQLFTTPFIWIVRGIINETLTLSFVWGSFRQQPLIVESLVVGLVSALGMVIHRMYRSLQHQKDHMETILHSIGDAVIVTDNNGRVEMMNPVAEKMTGWTLEEAYNQENARVFQISSTDNTAAPQDPVQRVLQTGKVVGLANHTKLTSRNGREYQIADSGAPIRGRHGDIEGAVLVFRDVTEQEQAAHQLQRELREKEVLLREIHHRVKNNLQIIISLLRLQLNKFEKSSHRLIFQDSIQRILTIALVHDQMYQQESFAQIDFGKYCRSMLSKLVAFADLHCEIHFDITAPKIHLDLETAIPCGLILNELVTNSLKHAFSPGEEGYIRLHAGVGINSTIECVYEDSGKGLSEEVDFTQPASLGLQLIHNLSDQIGAAITLEQRAPARFRLSIPVSGKETGTADPPARPST